MLFLDAYDSPVGRVGVLGGPSGLRAVGWQLPASAGSTEPDSTLRQVIAQLREYLVGQRRSFDVALDLPRLEPTTVAVLRALQTVPYGATVTYAELAARSGTGLPARAIGSILGANPVPLVIPCHRVVAGNGLGGYSGGRPGEGIATKRWLLELEGALPPTLL